MHIELLWMIPVIAFAAFLFIVAFYAQRGAEQRAKGADLSNEVALFNAGHGSAPVPAVHKPDEERLQEMQKAINSVNELLANQQQTIQEFHKESNVYTKEINDLKEKLRTVFKEYDIALSENYSLRAKVKQLTKQLQEPEPSTGATQGPLDPFLTRSMPHHKPELHLYDDTRLINLASMDSDDMSESTDSLAR
jgi:hypothetical protein